MFHRLINLRLRAGPDPDAEAPDSGIIGGFGAVRLNGMILPAWSTTTILLGCTEGAILPDRVPDGCGS